MPDRGPSLIGVGAAAVDFQVHTGRMPLARQEAEADDKPAVFTDEEIDQLVAYVQANGGGPTLPDGRPRATATWPRAASCSGSTAPPATPSPARAARSPPASTRPACQDATDREIYAAMLTGPENMPVFGDNQLTPEEKRAIITYVQTLNEQATRAAPASAGSARSPRAW